MISALRCRRPAYIILLILSVLVVNGCGDSRREAQRRLALSELNLHYANFGAIFGRGPKDAEELKRFLDGVTTNGQPAKIDPRIFRVKLLLIGTEIQMMRLKKMPSSPTKNRSRRKVVTSL
jgi:hypothetical protein